ncbi:hypothetical protein FB45DRAFT_760134 [Roridomyces roridus]|uniref:Uncharacterized protein n=1 Tax=Roridomyces roridus TaxID=1738132 RepID=A0AAD7B7B5_9AGAR|nr:hypothetical protein FB45DRAFT_760134 [Roridomyces roridus]
MGNTPSSSRNLDEEIRHNTYYLGSPTVCDELAWAEIAGQHCLVTPETARAHRLASAGSTQTQSTLEPEPAGLTMVARLSFEGFFMDADGCWRGPLPYTKDFADHKQSAKAVAPPPGHPFAPEFMVVLHNLGVLTDKVTTSSSKTGVFNPKENPLTVRPGKGIRRPGCLPYQRLARLSQSQGISRGDSEIQTHQVYRLPAYDTDGDLIHPSKYREKLMGAVVEVAFTLQHWEIVSKLEDGRQRKTDAFGADIQRMRVLVSPPPRTPSTPTRKRAHPPLKDPGSPSKRARRE